MASVRRETAEEVAFRKTKEAVTSTLSTALNAVLPEGTDYHYYKTFGEFRSNMEELQRRVKGLLLKFPKAKDGAEALNDPDETLNWMIELMDKTLQRVDTAVDEGTREVEKLHPPTFWSSQNNSALPTSAGQVAGTRAADKQAKKALMLEAQLANPGMQRPQDTHQWEIDNSNTPFKGLLNHWKEYIQLGERAPARLLPYLSKIQLDAEGQPPQPLLQILAEIEYPEWELQAGTPIMYRALDDTPLTYVETEEQLREMVRKLNGATEIAVDLEHHSFRTFQGLTCLMQLSDRHEDYIIDVLKLRPSVGPLLAPIFADPKVVKVMHGADWDVIWLQRDFGIYIANLFDTGQATRVLQHPRFGLGHMLERLCKVKTDKRYQLADWRIRPLQSEMLLYARMDTHYLLYMYDLLRAELVWARNRVPEALAVPIPNDKPNGALGTVLERSRQICMKQYMKPIFTEKGYLDLLGSLRDQPLLDKRQEAVFAELYRWRDETARARDDSVDFVMSKRMLLNISKALPLSTKQLRQALKGDNTPSMVHAASDEIAILIAQTLRGLHQSSPQIEIPSSGEPNELVGGRGTEVASTLSTAAEEQAQPDLNLHAGLRPEAPDVATASVPTAQVPVSHATLAGRPVPSAAADSQSLEQLQSQPAIAVPIETAVVGPAVTDQQFMRKYTLKSPSHNQQGLQASSMHSQTDANQPEQAHELKGQGIHSEAANPVDVPESLPVGSASSKENRVAAPPVRPIKQLKSGGMRAMLGRKARPVSSIPGSGHPAVELTLPSSVAALQKVSHQIAERSNVRNTQDRIEAALQECSPTLGSQIRDVADALRLENDSEVRTQPGIAPEKPVQPSRLGEFLPLPISQQYPKRGLHKLSPTDSAAEPDKAGQARGDADLRLEGVLREAGLETDSESESEAKEPAETPDLERAKKRQRFDLTDDSGFLSPSTIDSPRDSAIPGFGMRSELSGNRKRQKEAKPNAVQSTEDTQVDGNGIGFDYSAARAAAPGLDLDLSLEGGRGQSHRGQGSRNRGKSGLQGGRSAGAAPTSNGFSLYSLDERSFMKGGKRSSVMPRSGNRNLTFG